MGCRYVRVQVVIDVRQPLMRGVMLCIKSKPLPIQVKYERLSHFCFTCGKLGHTHKYCQLPAPKEGCFLYSRFMMPSPALQASKRMLSGKDG